MIDDPNSGGTGFAVPPGGPGPDPAPGAGGASAGGFPPPPAFPAPGYPPAHPYPPGAGYPPPAPVGYQGPYAPPGPYGPAGGYPAAGPYGPAGGYPAAGPYAPTGSVGQPGAYLPPGAAPYAPTGSVGPPGAYAPPGAAPPPYGPGLYQPQPQGWHYAPTPLPPTPRRTPEERAKLVRRSLVIAVVVVVVAGAGFWIGALLAPTGPKSASSLFKSALAAAESSGSFHYTELSTTDGTPDDITGDAGPDGGRQVITTTGSSGRDVFDLRLVKGVVYFRGNRPAVIDQLGVTATKAGADVDRWVAVRKGEAPYATFAAGITASSNLSQLPKTFVPATSAKASGTTRIDGGLDAGKNRAAVGTADMVIDSATSLPESLDAQASGTDNARVDLQWTFSHWGETVKVTAPPKAVAYSSLGAKAPSKHS